MECGNATLIGLVFKPIPSFDGYFCSDDGRVWSSWIPRRKKQTWPPRELAQRTDVKGYRRVSFGERSVRRSMMVHRLVLLAFHGDPPAGCESCHCDGDRTNNAARNLRWDTHRENIRDSMRHGTFVVRRGVLNGSTSLTESDVAEIRQRRSDGESPSAIGLEYGLTRQAVRMICTRVTWKHVP